jgi:hypothetical protein
MAPTTGLGGSSRGVAGPSVIGVLDSYREVSSRLAELERKTAIRLIIPIIEAFLADNLTQDRQQLRFVNNFQTIPGELVSTGHPLRQSILMGQFHALH